MRIKKTIVNAVLLLSMILMIYLMINYRNDLYIEKNRIKQIEELDDQFNYKFNEPQEKIISKNNDNSTAPTEYQNNLNLKNAIGKIIIDKLDLNYPILDGSTEENLNTTITRFYGSKINEIGNCVLAGHNMKNGTLFGRLSEISNGDMIQLIDNTGMKKDYTVFEISIVTPDDVSVLSQSTGNKKIVTLITCTNYGKDRLIIKAIEYE